MNDSATSSQSLLYRWDFLVLSIGPARQLQPHSHGAAELRISMESTISCHLDGDKRIDATSVLIPPGVRHQNTCDDALSSVLYLDVESRDFDHVAAAMVKQGPVYTGLQHLARAQASIDQIVRTVPGLDECLAIVRSNILGTPAAGRKLDRRVAEVLALLKRDPAARESVGDLASAVALSEDRLHHLFTTQVGVPIHRFRLWLRLKHASRLFLNGDDLTTAAHDSGFADSAHLSRTFVKMYGAPPSRLLGQHRLDQTGT